MLIMILAKIIVSLGFAALAALITTFVVLTMKKVVSLIKNKLGIKFGGTVVIANIRKLANEAIKEAKRKGNVKDIGQLEEMANKEGFAMAVQDANGNIRAEDVEIYEAEQMDPQIYEMMDDDGVLVVQN